MGDREQEVLSLHSNNKNQMVTQGGGYSNTMKQNNNLSYCYSCGYDVDYNRWKCHPSNRKRAYLTNFSREEAHTIAGASMKVKHKTLPDGSGDGKWWILAQQLRKSNWVMDQQDTWKHLQQQQQWHGWWLGSMVSITDKIYKRNIKPNYVNLLYFAQQNTCNRFSLISTDKDDDDNYKTTIMNNQTPTTTETA